MFVSQKRYDRLKLEMDVTFELAIKYGRQRNAAEAKALKLEQALRKATSSQEQFSQDEIRSLLVLIHPDKHDGKESAKVLTQKLLRMRK